MIEEIPLVQIGVNKYTYLVNHTAYAVNQREALQIERALNNMPHQTQRELKWLAMTGTFIHCSAHIDKKNFENIHVISTPIGAEFLKAQAGCFFNGAAMKLTHSHPNLPKLSELFTRKPITQSYYDLPTSGQLNPTYPIVESYYESPESRDYSNNQQIIDDMAGAAQTNAAKTWAEYGPSAMSKLGKLAWKKTPNLIKVPIYSARKALRPGLWPGRLGRLTQWNKYPNTSTFGLYVACECYLQRKEGKPFNLEHTTDSFLVAATTFGFDTILTKIAGSGVGLTFAGLSIVEPIATVAIDESQSQFSEVYYALSLQRNIDCMDTDARELFMHQYGVTRWGKHSLISGGDDSLELKPLFRVVKAVNETLQLSRQLNPFIGSPEDVVKRVAWGVLPSAALRLGFPKTAISPPFFNPKQIREWIAKFRHDREEEKKSLGTASQDPAVRDYISNIPSPYATAEDMEKWRDDLIGAMNSAQRRDHDRQQDPANMPASLAPNIGGSDGIDQSNLPFRASPEQTNQFPGHTNSFPARPPHGWSIENYTSNGTPMARLLYFGGCPDVSSMPTTWNLSQENIVGSDTATSQNNNTPQPSTRIGPTSLYGASKHNTKKPTSFSEQMKVVKIEFGGTGPVDHGIILHTNNGGTITTGITVSGGAITAMTVAKASFGPGFVTAMGAASLWTLGIGGVMAASYFAYQQHQDKIKKKITSRLDKTHALLLSLQHDLPKINAAINDFTYGKIKFDTLQKRLSMFGSKIEESEKESRAAAKKAYKHKQSAIGNRQLSQAFKLRQARVDNAERLQNITWLRAAEEESNALTGLSTSELTSRIIKLAEQGILSKQDQYRLDTHIKHFLQRLSTESSPEALSTLDKIASLQRPQTQIVLPEIATPESFLPDRRSFKNKKEYEAAKGAINLLYGVYGRLGRSIREGRYVGQTARQLTECLDSTIELSKRIEIKDGKNTITLYDYEKPYLDTYGTNAKKTLGEFSSQKITTTTSSLIPTEEIRLTKILSLKNIVNKNSNIINRPNSDPQTAQDAFNELPKAYRELVRLSKPGDFMVETGGNEESQSAQHDIYQKLEKNAIQSRDTCEKFNGSWLIYIEDYKLQKSLMKAYQHQNPNRQSKSELPNVLIDIEELAKAGKIAKKLYNDLEGTELQGEYRLTLLSIDIKLHIEYKKIIDDSTTDPETLQRIFSASYEIDKEILELDPSLADFPSTSEGKQETDSTTDDPCKQLKQAVTFSIDFEGSADIYSKYIKISKLLTKANADDTHTEQNKNQTSKWEEIKIAFEKEAARPKLIKDVYDEAKRLRAEGITNKKLSELCQSVIIQQHQIDTTAVYQPIGDAALFIANDCMSRFSVSYPNDEWLDYFNGANLMFILNKLNMLLPSGLAAMIHAPIAWYYDEWDAWLKNNSDLLQQRLEKYTSAVQKILDGKLYEGKISDGTINTIELGAILRSGELLGLFMECPFGHQLLSLLSSIVSFQEWCVNQLDNASFALIAVDNAISAIFSLLELWHSGIDLPNNVYDYTWVDSINSWIETIVPYQPGYSPANSLFIKNKFLIQNTLKLIVAYIFSNIPAGKGALLGTTLLMSYKYFSGHNEYQLLHSLMQRTSSLVKKEHWADAQNRINEIKDIVHAHGEFFNPNESRLLKQARTFVIQILCSKAQTENNFEEVIRLTTYEVNPTGDYQHSMTRCPVSLMAPVMLMRLRVICLSENSYIAARNNIYHEFNHIKRAIFYDRTLSKNERYVFSQEMRTIAKHIWQTHIGLLHAASLEVKSNPQQLRQALNLLKSWEHDTLLTKLNRNQVISSDRWHLLGLAYINLDRPSRYFSCFRYLPDSERDPLHWHTLCQTLQTIVRDTTIDDTSFLHSILMRCLYETQRLFRTSTRELSDNENAIWQSIEQTYPDLSELVDQTPIDEARWETHILSAATTTASLTKSSQSRWNETYTSIRVTPSYHIKKIPADGDCGYEAIGISRTEAVKLLKNNIMRVIPLLTPVISETLLEEEFTDICRNDIGCPLEILWSNDALRGKYAQQKSIALAFIDYDVKNKEIDGGWAHPCVLQALAEIEGFGLCMWVEKSPGLLAECKIGNENYHRHVPNKIDKSTYKHLLYNGSHFDVICFDTESQNLPAANGAAAAATLETETSPLTAENLAEHTAQQMPDLPPEANVDDDACSVRSDVSRTAYLNSMTLFAALSESSPGEIVGDILSATKNASIDSLFEGITGSRSPFIDCYAESDEAAKQLDLERNRMGGLFAVLAAGASISTSISLVLAPFVLIPVVMRGPKGTLTSIKDGAFASLYHSYNSFVKKQEERRCRRIGLQV